MYLQPDERRHRPSSEVWTLDEQGQAFRVYSLAADDQGRHAAYQALRSRIFHAQFGWQVVVTPDGREVDRYDERIDETVSVHTLFHLNGRQEVLLGGVRTCILHSWQDAMVMQEMRAAGLFPEEALTDLCQRLPASTLLEVTRLCLDRRQHALQRPAQRVQAQELVIAGVYQVAEQSGRTQVLAVVSAGYARLLEHMEFVLHPYYTHQPHQKTGYILTVIDLVASVCAMRQCGQRARVRRLLSLCHDTRWIEEERERESIQ